MSLKSILLDAIERRDGRMLEYDEMAMICRSMHRRVSNGERRLRELRDVVEIVRHPKGYIQGYRLRKAQGRLF